MSITPEHKEINTQTLKGKALNWAVALSQKFTPHFEDVTSITIKKVKDGSISPIVSINKDHEVIVISDDKKVANGLYTPSATLASLAKIAAKYRIKKHVTNGIWYVSCENVKNGKVSTDKHDCVANDVSLLVATCRAIVMYVIGANVSIPECLEPQKVEVNINELVDKELDLIVAKAEGVVEDSSVSDGLVDYKPTSDWGLGGQLQDKYDIEITRTEMNGKAQYAAKCEKSRSEEFGYGETRLIAICRSVAIACFGQTVEIDV